MFNNTCTWPWGWWKVGEREWIYHIAEKAIERKTYLHKTAHDPI